MKFECSGHICNITQIYKFMKIRALGAVLFHADERKDRHTWRS